MFKLNQSDKSEIATLDSFIEAVDDPRNLITNSLIEVFKHVPELEIDTIHEDYVYITWRGELLCVCGFGLDSTYGDLKHIVKHICEITGLLVWEDDVCTIFGYTTQDPMEVITKCLLGDHIMYRQHCGSLAESLRTITILENKQDLECHIKRVMLLSEDTTFDYSSPAIYDARVGWNSVPVTSQVGVLGYICCN